MNYFQGVIAAVKNRDDLKEAIKSNVKTIFHLTPNINSLADDVKIVHREQKKLLIHFDLSEGIGKDKHGILFVKHLHVDGIISTRVNIIKAAKEEGLFTVQRFFIVDSHSIDTTVESLKGSKTDMIEVMPGIAPKIIEMLKKKVKIPMIAGGLIETEDEVAAAIYHGASAVSTGKKNLWRQKDEYNQN